MDLAYKIVAGLSGLPFYQCTGNRVEYIIGMRSNVWCQKSQPGKGDTFVFFEVKPMDYLDDFAQQ